MGHTLKFPAEKKKYTYIYVGWDSRGVQRQPKLAQNCNFFQDLHQFVGKFSLSYLEIACLFFGFFS